jgi:DNA/RNA-binding domain of Phe-tRNA-synthetase-like protein
MSAASLEPQPGWVAPDLAEEFPALALDYCSLEARPRRSPQAVRERLRALSNRYTGAHVIHMRQDPVPWAYRVFFRQVGIDPDSDRTPAESVAVERLRAGGFKASNTVDDALTIAVAETGVPVIALDADRLAGEPGLRLAEPGELLGGEGRPLSTRQIVVADDSCAVAVLFGEVSEQRGVTPSTERIVLCSVRVKGVPSISSEEALWIASETLLAVDP